MKKGIKALLLTLSISFCAVTFAGCSFADDNYLDRLLCEHQYDEGIVTTASTCSKEGELTLTCVKCGTEKVEKINKQPHNYIAVAEEKPTCDKGRYSAHEVCTECKSVKGKTFIPATGHSLFEFQGKEPTCTQEGYTAYQYCGQCDTRFNYEIIPATGHTEVIVPGKPVTCMEYGYTASSYCSTCDEVLLESESIFSLQMHLYHDAQVDNICYACGSDKNLVGEIQSKNYVYTPYTGQDVMGKIIRVKWFEKNSGVQSVQFHTDIIDNPGCILPDDYSSYSIYSPFLVDDGVMGAKFRGCTHHDKKDISGYGPTCVAGSHPTNLSSTILGDYMYFKFPEVVEYPAFDFWGEITFFSNGVIDERDWGLVEIVSEKLTVDASSSNAENVLTDNGDGTYNYTFAGVGDFVHNSDIEIREGETLICDFSLLTSNIPDTSWFGVCFGNEGYKEAGLATYPHNQYWMMNYDDFGGRLWCLGGEPEFTLPELTLGNIMLVDEYYDYRITLTYGQGGKYTYELLRKASSETTYTLIHEYTDIECPTPSCLMLTGVNHRFVLENLCFYKI